MSALQQQQQPASLQRHSAHSIPVIQEPVSQGRGAAAGACRGPGAWHTKAAGGCNRGKCAAGRQPVETLHKKVQLIESHDSGPCNEHHRQVCRKLPNWRRRLAGAAAAETCWTAQHRGLGPLAAPYFRLLWRIRGRTLAVLPT